MTSPDLISLSGLAVMLFLGLRHGLDPDHVATVDGLTFGVLDRAPRLAPWVGTLFALGHGAVVTAIAVGVGLFGQRLTLAGPAAALVDWSPVALLLLVGTLNWRALRQRGEHYRPVGWKSRLFPRHLRESTHPLAILGVGVLFALAVDSIAQAATWGYAAAAHGGVAAAALVGLFFTTGMTLGATIYGQLMCRVLARAATSDRAARYRRTIGWFTVALAYGVAAYAILTALWPQLTPNEGEFALLGLLMVAGLAIAYGWLRSRGRDVAAAIAPGAGPLARAGGPLRARRSVAGIQPLAR